VNFSNKFVRLVADLILNEAFHDLLELGDLVLIGKVCNVLKCLIELFIKIGHIISKHILIKLDHFAAEPSSDLAVSLPLVSLGQWLVVAFNGCVQGFFQLFHLFFEIVTLLVLLWFFLLFLLCLLLWLLLWLILNFFNFWLITLDG